MIKEVAAELLIKHGYHFRFRDIAEPLQITRANIHYHFGSKQQLVEEVVVEYVLIALKAYRVIWSDQNTTFEEKVVRMKDETKHRYLKYNPDGRTGLPWSLLARMRMERDLLSEKARDAVERYGENLEKFILEGIRSAVRKQELADRTPVNDVAFQLVALTNSSGAITQDTGSFDRLEELYLGFSRIVILAYGNKEGRQPSKTA